MSDTGRGRLVGRAPSGDSVVVDEVWRVRDGRVELRRRSSVGGTLTCLETSADLSDGGNVRMAYRRRDGGHRVAIDLSDGELRVQVGPVVERTLVHGRPVPTSLLRFLPPGAARARRLLVEPYAVLARGDVQHHVSPGQAGRVITWTAAGLTEQLRYDDSGRILAVESPVAGLRLRSVEPVEGDLIDPCGPPHRTAPERFDTLASAQVPRLSSPQELTRWIADRVAYRPADWAPTPDEVLRRGSADCVGMALLAGAAARTLGWAARQVLGRVEGPSGPAWHQWAEVWYRGRWVPVDPASPSTGRRALRRFRPTPRAMLEAEVAMLTAGPAGSAKALDR